MRTTLQMVRIRVLGLLALACLVLAGSPAYAVGGRVLTKSDVVTVRVVGQPDLDTTSRVELDGTIQFPYVGRIRAAGLTEDAPQFAQRFREIAQHGTLPIPPFRGATLAFQPYCAMSPDPRLAPNDPAQTIKICSDFGIVAVQM